MHKILILAACLYSATLFSATLQYLPNTPLTQVTDLTLDIHQLLPGLELNTRGKQLLITQVYIDSEEDISVSHLPITIVIVPKKLKIDLNVNDETISFDSDRPVSSVYIAQFSKMIDRPIKLHIGDDRLIQAESQDLAQLDKELPLLKEFNIEIFLKELFQHQFALVGEKLKQDKTYIVKYDAEALPYVPSKVNYTITSINDESIDATIKGQLRERKISLNAQVQVDDKTSEDVEITFSGEMQGYIKWDRENALRHQLHLEYSYHGIIKIGHWEWKLEAELKVENESEKV